MALEETAGSRDYFDGEMPPSFPPAQKGSGAEELAEFKASGDASGSIAASVVVSESKKAGSDINHLDREKEEPQRSLISRVFSGFLEITVIGAVALVIAIVIKTFLVQPFEIPSESMADTFIPRDRILVNKMADTEAELHRGDIVVFVDPGGWLSTAETTEPTGILGALNKVGSTIGLLPENAGNHLVKRIIGMPGDEVTCCTDTGKLTINGVEVTEPYLKDSGSASLEPFSVTVPQGHLWVLGDNRNNSRDSRYHQQFTGFGFVPIENVEGRAWLRMYPFSRFTTLKSQSEVFANVPSANSNN